MDRWRKRCRFFFRVQGAWNHRNAHFEGPGDAEIGKKRRCYLCVHQSDRLLMPHGIVADSYSMVTIAEVSSIFPKPPELFCFGATAERYVARLPQGLSAIVCDGSSAALALAKAIELRRQAMPFLFFPLLEHGPGKTARALALEILIGQPNPDEQRILFEGLSKGHLHRGDRNVAKAPYHDPYVVGTLGDLMRTADGVVFRSQTERTYIEELFSCRRSFSSALPFVDVHIPATRPNENANRIIVWAPYESANELTLYAYALSDLKKPAIFICEGSLPNCMHEFVDPTEATYALAKASVIVDTNLSDPGSALAFANRGFGIVAAHTSGAHEYIQGITTYKTERFLEIAGGVSRARASRKTFAYIPPNTLECLHKVLENSIAPLPQELPLITIVVPTYNRPTELRKLLDAFAQQHYPHIEVIVVNDCGDSVKEIVEEFPFARYCTTSKNSGCGEAIKIGFLEARGTYVASLADDDLQYPTHISDCVAGIAASKLDVIHANTVSRIDGRNADGRLVTTGHSLTFHSDFDRTLALSLDCVTSCISYITTKEAMLSVLPLHEHFPSSNDHLLWLELSKYHDFAHVDRVNVEFRVRHDGSSYTSQVDYSQHIAKERAAVLAYFLPPDRPLIKDRQAATLERLSRTGTIPGSLLALDPPLEIV
jgi:hypothetical protein